MNKKEAKEALIQASRIIDQWEKNELESYEAMEMISPLLATITAHVERVLDPAAGSSSDPNLEKAEDLETPGAEEDEAEEKEKEEIKEGDLFSKTEDLEAKNEDVREEDDESKKSKKLPKKKRKEFAGSNGEIPF